MKAFRIFQVVFILFGLIVVSFAMGLTDPDPKIRKASLWLLSSAATLGALWSLATFFISKRNKAGNVAAALGKLMLIGLPASTIVLFAVFFGLDLHGVRTVLTVASTVVKLAYGFFAGWLWVVVLMFLVQLARPAPVEENDEDEDDDSEPESQAPSDNGDSR